MTGHPAYSSASAHKLIIGLGTATIGDVKSSADLNSLPAFNRTLFPRSVALFLSREIVQLSSPRHPELMKRQAVLYPPPLGPEICVAVIRLTLGTPMKAVGRTSLRVSTSDPLRASACANHTEEPTAIGTWRSSSWCCRIVTRLGVWGRAQPSPGVGGPKRHVRGIQTRERGQPMP